MPSKNIRNVFHSRVSRDYTMYLSSLEKTSFPFCVRSAWTTKKRMRNDTRCSPKRNWEERPKDLQRKGQCLELLWGKISFDLQDLTMGLWYCINDGWHKWYYVGYMKCMLRVQYMKYIDILRVRNFLIDRRRKECRKILCKKCPLLILKYCKLIIVSFFIQLLWL